MEGSHSPEFSQKTPATTERGYSEKRAARALENSQVKKRNPFVLPIKQKVFSRAARGRVSAKDKILAAHEKNAKVLIDLIKTLGLLTKDSVRQEENLMEEIRNCQKIQDELLNALVLENRGELKEETLSQSVRDLIQ